MNFPDYIKKLRIEKGLSQSELERVCELPATYVSKLENGNFKTVKDKTIEKLAAGLTIDPAKLKSSLNQAIPGDLIINIADLPDDIVGKIRKFAVINNVSDSRAVACLLTNPENPEEALLYSEYEDKDI